MDPKGGYIARCPGALAAGSLGASVFTRVEQKRLLSEVAVSVFKTQCDTRDHHPPLPQTAMTSGSNHKGSTSVHKVDLPHPSAPPTWLPFLSVFAFARPDS